MYLCGQQEGTSSHLTGDTERWTLTWDRCGWNSKAEVLGTQVLDPAGQAPPHPAADPGLLQNPRISADLEGSFLTGASVACWPPETLSGPSPHLRSVDTGLLAFPA